MRAWLFTGVGEPLRSTELPDPEPGPGDLVIRTMAAGLCRTDLDFLSGSATRWLGHMPIVLGHEVAGVVTRIGADVHDIQVGDRVAIRTGPDGPGVAYNGGFGTTVVTKSERAARIPDEVPFTHAAVATDAGLTSHHAVKVVGRVTAGMRVGVVGLGGLGSFGLQIAAATGAEVTAVVRNESLRPTAMELGASRTVASVSDLTGENLDVVVDFAGYSSTVSGAVAAVRPGGRVVLAGVGDTEVAVPSQFFVGMGIELAGSPTGDVGELREVLAMIADGTIRAVTTSIGFDEIPAGLDRLARGGLAGRLVADLSSV